MNNRQITQLIRMLMRTRRGKKSRWLIGLVVLLIGYAFLQPVIEKQFGISLPKLGDRQQRSASTTGPSTSGSHQADATSDGEQAILDAFANRQSDVIVQCMVEVKKNLADDNVGLRHQKMILRLPSGHTVMMAHNIDLADRVPAKEGDQIEVKGEYEYSGQGGVIHWTHHDPRGRHIGGWIKHKGVTYE